MFYADPTNFGKPRKMDVLLARQMLFDATFEWLPTQGWSLVPIENYGGGGAEAAFAPLEDNTEDYDLAWASYMGYGVAGVCWRGRQIYDGPKSKAVVTQWAAFYKRYRSTLINSKLIHVRRPDGQSLDAILHANPSPSGGAQKERGILFAFNPTTAPVSANVTVGLYYTGLTDTAMLSPADDSAAAASYSLRRDFSISVPMDIPANGYAWWAVRAPPQ